MTDRRIRYGVMLAALAAVAFCGAVALAAGTDAKAAGVAEPAEVTWHWLFRSGGWLMYVLGAMSIAMVAFVIYFFMVLRPGEVVPKPLRRELLEKLVRADLEGARRSCEYHPSPLATVALAAVDYVTATPDASPELIKDVIQSEGARQTAAIQSQVQYLFDIAVLSPMVGLVGTVFGMIHAFHSVALDLAKAKPMLLAAGVSEALVMTASGLIVGIPAMAFYSYFRGRSSNLISSLECTCTEVLTALTRKS